MKKEACLCLCLVLILTINIFAQTDIPGGSIAGNSTWDLAGSPYIVTGTVVILNTGSLTIEPNVVVEFGQSCLSNINVSGELFADSVMFIAVGMNPCNTYRMIDVKPNATCALAYCRLQGSGSNDDWRGIGWYEEGDSDVSINYCEMSDFNLAIEVDRGSTGIIFGNYFHDVNSGIHMNRGSTLSIDSCVFEQNEISCVKTYENSNPFISNCVFGNSPNALGIDVTSSNPIIENCCFSDLDYAISNTSSYTISAENCWWNSETGPQHTSNPDGTGEIILGSVDFVPWKNGCEMMVKDTLSIPPVRSYDSEVIVPLRYYCRIPTAAWQAGLCWNESPEFELQYVTFDSTACQDWGTLGADIDNENQEALLYAFVGQEFDYILTGDDTVLVYLHFANLLNTFDSVCIMEPYLSTDSLPLIIDTCTIIDNGLLFADTVKDPEPNQFVPIVDFDTAWAFDSPDYIYSPGNVNNADTLPDGDPEINLIDILYLINHVYDDPAGPEPKPWPSGDVNGDCDVNLLDILLLIDYVYGDPPKPDLLCGCSEPALNKQAPIKFCPDMNHGGTLSMESKTNKSIINLDAKEILKGIEITVRILSDQIETSCLANNLQIYSKHDGELLRIALFDINGEQAISKGKHVLLEIDGEVEIISAFAGDENAQPVYLDIANKNDVGLNIPKFFALYQNHPNPFNPVTQISFEISLASHVSFDIYNITGQKVSTVADGKFEPGNHTVEWDGSSFASGVYFYRIQAGDIVETKKMMLLK